MYPQKGLPLPDAYSEEDIYVNDLLSFVTGSEMHQKLVGGVHILDFFTRTPDLYESLLERRWREWFDRHELIDLLDFILREDMSKFLYEQGADQSTWRGKAPPPPSLVQYIHSVRRLLLRRDVIETGVKTDVPARPTKIPHHIAIGMKEKKIHEVSNFAHYVSNLTDTIKAHTGQSITHLVDFGSGQNYLGRALASEPYNRHVIAVESRSHNVETARAMDVKAKLAPKDAVWRNKKEFRAGLKKSKGKESSDQESVNSSSSMSKKESVTRIENVNNQEGGKVQAVRARLDQAAQSSGSVQYVTHRLEDGDLSSVIDEIITQPPIPAKQAEQSTHPPHETPKPDETSDNTYSKHSNESVITQEPSQDPRLLVMSIHSCGNLSHHGLRSLVLNPSVSAVALIGCCYNLLTERLAPPSYKMPSLRPLPAPSHPNLEPGSSSDNDASCNSSGGSIHGFPMSKRLCTYTYQKPHVNPDTNSHINPNINTSTNNDKTTPKMTTTPQAETPQTVGIHLNITARMMAVQAPQNWGSTDSDAFFTRHFFRALLQKVFLDRGVVEAPAAPSMHTDTDINTNADTDPDTDPDNNTSISSTSRSPIDGRSPAGSGVATSASTTSTASTSTPPNTQTQPIIIGSLRKQSYTSFLTYVRAALAKLQTDTLANTPWSPGAQHASLILQKMAGLTDEDLQRYEREYSARKKELSVVWSLMAYSAGVVEAVIVVDRWLWLGEQEGVGARFVESVFEYAKSPRNLVVVGVKKAGGDA